jgi:hypothetical protein
MQDQMMKELRYSLFVGITLLQVLRNDGDDMAATSPKSRNKKLRRTRGGIIHPNGAPALEIVQHDWTGLDTSGSAAIEQ